MSLLSTHRYVNIQVQAGTRDWGVFAIANALSIANGEDSFKKINAKGFSAEHAQL